MIDFVLAHRVLLATLVAAGVRTRCFATHGK